MESVSVFIPCYNYGRFLRQAVESVLTQTGVDVEVIILDDASPDDTPMVAAGLVEQDRRVEYRRHATNQGHITTYNEGIDWASGDYTLLLSADDLLTPGALARAVKVMNDHPEVGMVYGRAIPFRSDGPSPEPIMLSERFGSRIFAINEFLESCCVGADNPVYAPTAVVRTRLQKELGGYRHDLPHAGDMEMWVRFAAHSDLARLDIEQAWYRLHSSNMGVEWHKLPLAELEQRRAAFDRIFDSYSARVKDTARLRNLADRALARQSFWEASMAFDQGDLSSCQGFLDYALALDTDLRRDPAWARLNWKRRVGPRVWSALLPVVKLTRQARAILSSQPGHQSASAHFQES